MPSMSSTTPGWKNRKQAAQVLQSLKTLCLLGARRPADQCHRHTRRCLGFLRPIWTEKTETRRGCAGAPSQCFWATVSGYPSGDNPAR
jgi:hypothetical protein